MSSCNRGVCTAHTVLTTSSTKWLYKPKMYGRAVWDMIEAPVGSCQFVTENKTVSFRSEELVEPQASALAKLCAYCVFAALEFQNNATPGHVNSRKRSRRDMEGEVQPLAVVNLIAVHHTLPWAALFFTTFPPRRKRVALQDRNALCEFLISTCKNLLIGFYENWLSTLCHWQLLHRHTFQLLTTSATNFWIKSSISNTYVGFLNFVW